MFFRYIGGFLSDLSVIRTTHLHIVQNVYTYSMHDYVLCKYALSVGAVKIL
jgi:hypothetical protein